MHSDRTNSRGRDADVRPIAVAEAATRSLSVCVLSLLFVPKRALVFIYVPLFLQLILLLEKVYLSHLFLSHTLALLPSLDPLDSPSRESEREREMRYLILGARNGASDRTLLLERR